MKIRSLLLIGLLTLTSSAFADVVENSHGISKKALTLRMEMRRLWSEHVEWTRFYIISTVADISDSEKVAGRLLRNQSDIGNAVKPFYGNAAGNQLTALLKEHILIAASLINALKANNRGEIREKQNAWFANSEEIAKFLRKANPRYFHVRDMRIMLREHLSLTSREVAARMNSDWDTDIAVYDKVSAQALTMADHFSEGIIKQFPNKF